MKDILCEEEIHFSPYNGPELEVILQERADGALFDDAANRALFRFVLLSLNKIPEVHAESSISGTTRVSWPERGMNR